jgi:hypothetical protein
MGVFGEPQLVFGALKTQLGNRKSQGLIGLGKRVGGNRKALLEFASHAHRLGALTGKQKSNLHVHSRRDCIPACRASGVATNTDF